MGNLTDEEKKFAQTHERVWLNANISPHGLRHRASQLKRTLEELAKKDLISKSSCDLLGSYINHAESLVQAAYVRANDASRAYIEQAEKAGGGESDKKTLKACLDSYNLKSTTLNTQLEALRSELEKTTKHLNDHKKNHSKRKTEKKQTQIRATEKIQSANDSLKELSKARDAQDERIINHNLENDSEIQRLMNARDTALVLVNTRLDAVVKADHARGDNATANEEAAEDFSAAVFRFKRSIVKINERIRLQLDTAEVSPTVAPQSLPPVKSNSVSVDNRNPQKRKESQGKPGDKEKARSQDQDQQDKDQQDKARKSQAGAVEQSQYDSITEVRPRPEDEPMPISKELLEELEQLKEAAKNRSDPFDLLESTYVTDKSKEYHFSDHVRSILAKMQGFINQIGGRGLDVERYELDDKTDDDVRSFISSVRSDIQGLNNQYNEEKNRVETVNQSSSTVDDDSHVVVFSGSAAWADEPSSSVFVRQRQRYNDSDSLNNMDFQIDNDDAASFRRVDESPRQQDEESTAEFLARVEKAPDLRFPGHNPIQKRAAKQQQIQEIKGKLKDERRQVVSKVRNEVRKDGRWSKQLINNFDIAREAFRDMLVRDNKERFAHLERGFFDGLFGGDKQKKLEEEFEKEHSALHAAHDKVMAARRELGQAAQNYTRALKIASIAPETLASLKINYDKRRSQLSFVSDALDAELKATNRKIKGRDPMSENPQTIARRLATEYNSVVAEQARVTNAMNRLNQATVASNEDFQSATRLAKLLYDLDSHVTQLDHAVITFQGKLDVQINNLQRRLNDKEEQVENDDLDDHPYRIRQAEINQLETSLAGLKRLAVDLTKNGSKLTQQAVNTRLKVFDNCAKVAEQGDCAIMHANAQAPNNEPTSEELHTALKRMLGAHSNLLGLLNGDNILDGRQAANVTLAPVPESSTGGKPLVAVNVTLYWKDDIREGGWKNEPATRSFFVDGASVIVPAGQGPLPCATAADKIMLLTMTESFVRAAAQRQGIDSSEPAAIQTFLQNLKVTLDQKQLTQEAIDFIKGQAQTFGLQVRNIHTVQQPQPQHRARV